MTSSKRRCLLMTFTDLNVDKRFVPISVHQWWADHSRDWDLKLWFEPFWRFSFRYKDFIWNTDSICDLIWKSCDSVWKNS